MAVFAAVASQQGDNELICCVVAGTQCRDVIGVHHLPFVAARSGRSADGWPRRWRLPSCPPPSLAGRRRAAPSAPYARPNTRLRVTSFPASSRIHCWSRGVDEMTTSTYEHTRVRRTMITATKRQKNKEPSMLTISATNSHYTHTISPSHVLVLAHVQNLCKYKQSNKQWTNKRSVSACHVSPIQIYPIKI